MFEGSQPTLGLNNIMIEDEDLERYKIATIQMGADRSGCIFGCIFWAPFSDYTVFTDFIVQYLREGIRQLARANFESRGPNIAQQFFKIWLSYKSYRGIIERSNTVFTYFPVNAGFFSLHSAAYFILIFRDIFCTPYECANSLERFYYCI